MDSTTVLLLVAQIVLAGVGVAAMLRLVVPAVNAVAQPALLTDVWIPLIIATPVLFLARRVATTVAGAGWAPVAGPVCMGAVAVGCGLVVGARGGAARGPGAWALVTWGAAGLVMLLLGAAHDLTLWTGQCALAVAAVLLWMNTPDPAAEPRALTPAARNAVLGTLVAAACGVGQGVVSLAIEGPLAAASLGVAVVWGLVIGLGAALGAGGEGASRIGGWTATLGMLIGIGVISLLHLIPQAFAAAAGRDEDVHTHVAHSFGSYAGEALLLVLLPAATLTLRVPGAAARGAAGLAVLASAGFLIAWRLANV